MSNIIPIFYDHSSGRSILRFADSEDKNNLEAGPTNILKLAKKHNLKKIYFVSDCFHTFVETFKLCKKAGVQLVFGLEITMCPAIKEKSDESVKNHHKIIVFGKNSQSYKDLIKLYSSYKTNPEAKYYVYRCDDEILKTHWTDNLVLALPFFSSAIARNTLIYGANIIPNYPVDPVIMREMGSNHIHEGIINFVLDKYNKNQKLEEIKTKTIYYENRKDSKPWIIFRSIYEKTDFSSPGLDFCCSDEFCFESYLELTK
jgi:DNA polymerase III alpha subunit